MLKGNPLQFPFSQFRNEEYPAKLFQFLKDYENQEDTWNRIKLIAIGNSNSGKVKDHVTS